MDYRVKEINGTRVVVCFASGSPAQGERLALDLVGACGEHDTDRVLFLAGALPDDFYRLRTGMAGAVLQKFANYRIRAALVLGREQSLRGKFDDFRVETNRGGDFRIFDGEAEAESWLACGEMKRDDAD